MVLVGRVGARGRESRTVPPRSVGVRGTASMPEAPLERGGIATNEQILASVKVVSQN